MMNADFSMVLHEEWHLTFKIFTDLTLSSQLLVISCMYLNKTWQKYFTTSLDVHVGRYILQES